KANGTEAARNGSARRRRRANQNPTGTETRIGKAALLVRQQAAARRPAAALQGIEPFCCARSANRMVTITSAARNNSLSNETDMKLNSGLTPNQRQSIADSTGPNPNRRKASRHRQR